MAVKPKALILDSWAVMAFYEGEPAGQRVGKLVADAIERGTPLWMSVVNAGEVWYVTARRISPEAADRTIDELRSLGVQFESAEWKLARDAAVLKSRHKMSYADAFAAALAVQKNGHLITGDREFKHVEGDVRILWLQ